MLVLDEGVLVEDGTHDELVGAGGVYRRLYDAWMVATSVHDGVLTTTRVVHAAAWKRTFDEFLADWDARHETISEPFDDHADYAAHVDGKSRQDGVRDFLVSRGIELPDGEPDDPPERETVW